MRFLDLGIILGTFNLELIGSLQNLRYLGLSPCAFRGAIPRQLENLSRLVFLDLSYTEFLEAESLMRLSYLPSLKHLDMSGSNLSQSVDWFQAINSIPSPLSLHLSYCQLSLVVPPSTPSHANHTSASLADIDLSINSLPSSNVCLTLTIVLNILINVRTTYKVQFQMDL